jgi:hypothetical protein
MPPLLTQRNSGGGAPSVVPQTRFWQWIVVGLLLVRARASAQQALMNSLPAGTATDQNLQLQRTDYTYKNGDFKLWVTPAMDLMWIDNIYLTQTNRQDDFVLRPTLGLITSYPISQEYLLQLNLTVGYNKYLNHDELDSFYLQSGSGLSFDVFVKDIDFNLHDRFSYVQDPSQNSQVANTGTYGTFQNTAGLSASWNLTRLVLSTGYDHQNSLSTSSQFNDTDLSSELFFARAGYVVSPRLTTGLESSVSLTTYQQDVLNNNQSYSIGAYADYKPDEYFELQPRAGYVIYQFDNTSQALRTSDLNSWYADLKVTHAITDALSYSLDAGHRVSLGVESDASQAWYVTPGVTWNLRKDWIIQGSMSYENGKQGIGSTQIGPAGNLVSENYSYFNGTVGFSHAITKRISFSLNYRLTLRSSSAQDQSYTQNEVDLQLSYHPQ